MKYAFAGPGWIAALHGIIAERARIRCAEDPTLGFSMCEVFTGAPAGIANDGERAVWSCVVRDGVVDFRLKERDDVGLKIVADYAACAPLAAYDRRGEPERIAEFARLMAEAEAAGKIRVIATGSPGTLGSVHDAIARLTESDGGD